MAGRYLLDLGGEDLGKRACLPYFGSGHYLIHSTSADLEKSTEGPGKNSFSDEVHLDDKGQELLTWAVYPEIRRMVAGIVQEKTRLAGRSSLGETIN